MAERDHVGESLAEESLTSRDDFTPQFPARIVIRTKSASALAYSSVQRTPQSSRHRGPTAWMGRLNARSSTDLPGGHAGENLPSTSSGNEFFPSMAADGSEDCVQRTVQPSTPRGSTKRPVSLLETGETVRSRHQPIEDFKRLRGSRMLSDEWRNSPSLARPSKAEENVASLLLQRELPGVFRRNATPYRTFYTMVTPNHTILDVQHPSIFMRKFSPDGRFFVGFSGELQVVHIYRYRGIGSVGKYFSHSQAAPADELIGQHVLQRDIFRTLLREEFRVRIVPNEYMPHSIVKDFSLFTEDSRYLIVVTSGTPELLDDALPEIRRSNESLPLCNRSPLEDYKFFLISLEKGAVLDQLNFSVDKIPVSHSAGVYLLGNCLWILSTQHQEFQVFQIMDGKFVHQRTLGQYCFTNSGTTLTQWRSIFPGVPAAEEVFMGTLRQKLFMELFRVAQRESVVNRSYGPIMDFHRLYTFYKRLKIWKFQLLDGNRMLMKWAPEDVVTGKASDPSNYPQFFTFFDLEAGRFHGVYEYREANMLRLFEKYSSDFRNAPGQHPYFQCDTFYTNIAYERLKRLSMTAKSNGSPNDCCSRLLAMLPIPCQSFTPSPYVDMSLFQYDSTLISNSERVKGKVDEPIRFYSRDTGTLNFTLQVSRLPGQRRSKRVATQIFHPFDPLIITCEKARSGAVESELHFHVWQRP